MDNHLDPASGLLEEGVTLFWHDGPILLTLHDGNLLWIAMMKEDSEDGHLHYYAVRLSDAEHEAITTGLMSVRGAFFGKPCRDVRLDAAGFSFISQEESPYPDDWLPSKGTGVQIEWENLPDEMPAETPDLSRCPDFSR